MTFLQPALLFALPLIALPVVIHLIHLHRRRTVKWAAMMFLLAAQRMNKGFSKLRQYLILAARTLAVLAIILVASRPLAGGWLGITGGVPDTVLILLDRSASMEQQNLTTGMSKRLAGLRNLTAAIRETYGTRSHLVLIDSATMQATPLERAESLLDLPQTGATDTAADVPALLQTSLDYMTANQTGRTDVWMLSDLRTADWDAGGGRWEPLRGALASMKGVRFHLLSYPQPATGNLAVTVDHVTRRETAEKTELLLDVRITRNETKPEPLEIPLRFVIAGVTTTQKVEIKDNQLLMQALAVPIDKSTKRGAGRIELPADSNNADNVYHFVFDEPAEMKSVIVSDNTDEAEPLQAALSAAADPSRKYASNIIPPSRAAEIPWDDTALIIWHAALPAKDDVIANQLNAHVKEGRTVIFLPPERPDANAIFGLKWGAWTKTEAGKPEAVEWWRNDSGLLANTRAGTALPVGDLEISRRCVIEGEGVPLARVAGHSPVLMRAASESTDGGAYFLGTLPGTSSLARDGVVMFAMLHRALNDGSRSLGAAQQRAASRNALGADPSKWHRLEEDRNAPQFTASEIALHAGVVEAGGKLIALNRPASEDSPQTITQTTLGEMFAGLDYRYLEDQLENSRSLVSEVWRTFLVLMAGALVLEALLCLPSVRVAEKSEGVKKEFADAENKSVVMQR